MSASEWDIQVLRDLGISAAAEFVSLDAKKGDSIVAEWRAQSQDTQLLVYRLRAALKAQSTTKATGMLAREAKYTRDLMARLVAAMPQMVVDDQPHPAAFVALGRGITTPRAIRAFVRSWIVEHEQEPGAAYETRDAAYWWSVVNPEQAVAA